MSEPRTRTAAEVADHASDIVDETQSYAERVPERFNDKITWRVIERLAAQVEDLAAEVDRLQNRNHAPERRSGGVGWGSRPDLPA